MADDFAANSTTTGRLAIGKASSGNIDSFGDVDWFKITLAAGQVVQLDLTSNTAAAKPLADAYIAGVYTKAGVLLPDSSDDDGGSGFNAQLSFKAPAAGDYFVAASASGDITGAYLLNATDQTPPPPVLTIEAVTELQPEGNLGTTLMRFTVTRDGELGAASSATWSVHPSGATPATAADFSASRLPSGTVTFAANQDSATIEIPIRADTRYEPDASFSVVLSAPVGATLGGADGGTSIEVSASADNGVTEQFFRVTGGGAPFTVTSAADSVPLAVAIYVNGQLAADSAADGAYSGSLTLLHGPFLQAGDVVAVVTTGAAGQGAWDYTVDYRAGIERAAYIASAVIANDDPAPDDYPASSATKAALAIGGAFSGRVDNSGDADWVAVNLVTGQPYVFNLDASAAAGLADPALDLYDATGKLLASDDNGGAGLAAQLNVSVDSTGVYYLAARSADSQTGGYLLYGAFDTATAASAPTTTTTTTTTTIKDTTPPVLTSSTPSIDARGVSADASIKLVFSEAMARNAGAIELRGDDGTIVESFDAATSSRVTVQGNTIVIDPATHLAAGGYYRLSVGMGAFTDLAGNPVTGGVQLAFNTAAAGAALPMAGTAASDMLTGTGDNDSFTGTAGNDIIDGGAGFDQVRYAGKRADYSFPAAANGAQFVHKPGGGTDTLLHIERVVFDDGVRSFDLNGAAGQVYRIYQAAFNRVPDQQGLGFWIAAMEHGATPRDVAGGFFASPEAQALYGAAPTSAQLVNRLYDNVLHRAPDADGFKFWTGLLDNHTLTMAEVLTGFSESPENQAAVIGAIAQGINYLPFG